MKNIVFIAASIGLLTACQSSKNQEQTDLPAGVHKVLVEEVLQTNQYTYLHVKDGDAEPWLAVTKMQAAAGETYYYANSLPMTDFVSKELNRTFKEILFLDNISTTPTGVGNTNTPSAPGVAENAMNSPVMNEVVPTANTAPAAAHTVVTEEVLQTSQYTYIRAKEGKTELWLAVAKMEVAVGKTYYFLGGLPMTDFASKELKRTFKEILFLDNISENPKSISQSATPAAPSAAATQMGSTGSAIPLDKKEIKLKHSKDDITISKLFENKKAYAGKTIKIKGEVIKFSSGIMKKNWIHLQDGTEASGKFDLTITTDQEVKVGDHITVEGVITLDKDFGFGYFYEVIMEDAKLVK